MAAGKRPLRPVASPFTLALLASTLVIAACGLVYELVAGAVASYLIGDALTQFSTVIGTYLFAMGIGAYLCQYLRRDLLARFIHIELLVGVLGGYSALALFWAYGAGLAFAPLLYALVALIGILVGLEIPLLLRLLREELAFEQLVSRVLSFDYLGALLASLVFPLWAVPRLGLTRTSLVFGLVNVAVAAVTWYLFRRRLRGARLWGPTLASALLLGTGLVFTERWQQLAERELYPEPVVYAEQSRYQRLVLTQRGPHVSLYLNGHLQFNARDEHRYHESLVHPAAGFVRAPRTALVLGGGDGLAVRELLRYPGIESITLVDLDARVTALARTQPKLVALNRGALDDARVRVVNADAWRWLETQPARFDLIVADFPDPGNFALGKLYSLPFYRLLAAHLAPGGAIAVQATSPLFARAAYWCTVATLEATGLTVTPYHVTVPSFGEWGFVLASDRPYVRPHALPGGLRYLTPETLPGLFAFSPDLARVPVEVNRLDNQIIVQYYDRAWKQLARE